MGYLNVCFWHVLCCILQVHLSVHAPNQVYMQYLCTHLTFGPLMCIMQSTKLAIKFQLCYIMRHAS